MLVVTQRKVSGSSKEKLGFLILFHFFLTTLDFYSNSLIFENLELFFKDLLLKYFKDLFRKHLFIWLSPGLCCGTWNLVP